MFFIKMICLLAPRSTSDRRLGTVGNRKDTMHGLSKDYSIRVPYNTSNFPMRIFALALFLMLQIMKDPTY